MTTTPIAELLADYYAAWCTGDPDQIVRFFAADAVFEDLAFGARFEGHDGVRTFARITYEGAPDFKITPDLVVVEGNHAAASWIMNGTHTGDMPGFPATGRRFEIRASSMIRLRETRIVRMTDYWNPNALISADG